MASGCHAPPAANAGREGGVWPGRARPPKRGDIMSFAKTLIAAFVLLLAQSAWAQDFDRPGAYASLNGVYSVETFDNVPSSFVKNPVGASGRFGYRINENFAAEAQAEYSGDFSDIGGDFSESLITLNGKVYLPYGRVQPYATVGIGAVIAAFDPGSNEESFVARVGGGVDVYFNESFGLLVEGVYNIPTDRPIDDATYVSIGWGLFFRF
jgi:opacity protein-like surface antigen